MFKDNHDSQSQWITLFQKCSQDDVSGVYYYDFDALKLRVESLQVALGPAFQILFSLKSNPSPQLVKFLVSSSNCGADVSSGNELLLAESGGVRLENIYFVGPGKSISELMECVKRKIGCVIVESVVELKVLNEISKTLEEVTPIALRINPNYEVRGIKMAMGGRSTQFGIDEEEAIAILRYSQSQYPHLKFIGIQAYVGTRILNANDAAWNIIQVFELAKRLDQFHVPLSMIDVGGGLGIPYYHDEPELNLNEFSNVLQSYLSHYPETLKNNCKFLLEAGRFLVGPVGYFLNKVVTVDQQGDIQNLEVASTPSLHVLSHGGLFASRRSFLGTGLTKEGLSRGRQTTKLWYRVNGVRHPWPISLQIPLLNEGDYVVFTRSGAYGPSASRVWENFEGYPAEYACQKGQILMIRKKETWKALTNEQIIYVPKHNRISA